MNFEEEKTKNQGTSQPEASQEEEKVNGDMAAELVELDDVQLATVVGGIVSWGREATLRDVQEEQSRWQQEIWDREVSDLLNWYGQRT